MSLLALVLTIPSSRHPVQAAMGARRLHTRMRPCGNASNPPVRTPCSANRQQALIHKRLIARRGRTIARGS